jgi:hypothetical protein
MNVRQLTTNLTARNGQTYVETLPVFLVTLTRNVKSQEMFKLNGLHQIINKVESSRAQTGLTQCATIAKTLAMSGPTESNPLDVVVWWWPPA